MNELKVISFKNLFKFISLSHYQQVIKYIQIIKLFIMNSPNFRQAPLNQNHQARFYNRAPSNHANQNSPVFVHYTFQNGYPQQKTAIKTMPDVNQVPQTKKKQVENVNRNEVRNIYDKAVVNSALVMEARTSDMSIHSLKQQDENIDRVNNRIKTINDQLTAIFSKLTTHDKQIQQLSQKNQKKDDQNKNLQLVQKIQDIVWKQVTKQINQSQQHLAMQNKLIKADLDTLKLQMMCYADKKQVKDIFEKNQQNQKLIRKLVKQVQQNSSQELKQILQKRKTDIQRFQKQVQEIKAKLMEVVFTSQKNHHPQEICLMKCLSFKVLHEMQVYNEKQLKWLELGTGQTVYGIDQEGYLLDNKDKYITDQNGNLIKLQQNHRNMLKKYGLTR